MQENGATSRTVSYFLAKYLPRKYALGTGQIIDRYGGMSLQRDIVVYDALNCPLLLIKEGYQIFPVEAVLGIVEVKSVLDARSLKESVENIRSAKNLVRNEPVAGSVFAYRSSYGHNPPMEAVARAFQDATKEIVPRHRIDFLCVLTDGLLREYKGRPDWGEKRCSLEIWQTVTTPLLLFLSWLLQLIEERQSSMPDIVGYATGGELGMVRFVNDD